MQLLIFPTVALLALETEMSSGLAQFLMSERNFTRIWNFLLVLSFKHKLNYQTKK